MAGRSADRVMETGTGTTGDITLAGAVAGYISFNTAFGTNSRFRYCIEEVSGSGVPNGDWEVGSTYLSTSSNMKRNADTIVEANSAGTTALITFAGALNVFCPVSGLSARKSTHGFDLQYGMP